MAGLDSSGHKTAVKLCDMIRIVDASLPPGKAADPNPHPCRSTNVLMVAGNTPRAQHRAIPPCQEVTDHQLQSPTSPWGTQTGVGRLLIMAVSTLHGVGLNSVGLVMSSMTRKGTFSPAAVKRSTAVLLLLLLVHRTLQLSHNGLEPSRSSLLSTQ